LSEGEITRDIKVEERGGLGLGDRAGDPRSGTIEALKYDERESAKPGNWKKTFVPWRVNQGEHWTEGLIRRKIQVGAWKKHRYPDRRKGSCAAT